MLTETTSLSVHACLLISFQNLSTTECNVLFLDMYVCMTVCMYVCMCICMYTYKNVFSFSLVLVSYSFVFTQSGAIS